MSKCKVRGYISGSTPQQLLRDVVKEYSAQRPVADKASKSTVTKAVKGKVKLP